MRLEARNRAVWAWHSADVAKKAIPKPCQTPAMGKPPHQQLATKAPPPETGAHETLHALGINSDVGDSPFPKECESFNPTPPVSVASVRKSAGF